MYQISNYDLKTKLKILFYLLIISINEHFSFINIVLLKIFFICKLIKISFLIIIFVISKNLLINYYCSIFDIFSINKYDFVLIINTN